MGSFRSGLWLRLLPSRLRTCYVTPGSEEGNVPDTWPEQAALAADHKWDELRVLQDHLRGDRRV